MWPWAVPRSTARLTVSRETLSGGGAEGYAPVYRAGLPGEVVFVHRVAGSACGVRLYLCTGLMGD